MRIQTLVFFLLTALLPLSSIAQPAEYPWKHRYDQTLVMKMFLSKPDDQGGSAVSLTFQDVLQVIKKVDQLSLQVPKIIYLVGWQYKGHDDKYPAFFEVNELLKRDQDKDATTSLRWLIREARAYHTTVSLHMNMTDAYDDSPLWDTYVANDLISKTANGSLKVIGNYNNKKAYHINYKREWESGWAQKRIDSLLGVLPEIKQGGTIHLDAWIARPSEGHGETKEQEIVYQQKIADYWLSQGVDPTTEWVMDYMKGRVPYYWHFNDRTEADYLNDPAALVTGGRINPDSKKQDHGLMFLFGTSIYGETIFPRSKAELNSRKWEQDFVRDFYLDFPQYTYLNNFKRLRLEGIGKDRIAYYSDGLQVKLNDRTIWQDQVLLRDNNTLSFPIAWKDDNSMVIYSDKSMLFKQSVLSNWSDVKNAMMYKITNQGLQHVKDIKLVDGRFEVEIDADTPYLLKPLN